MYYFVINEYYKTLYLGLLVVRYLLVIQNFNYSVLFQFNFNSFHVPVRPFNTQYKCYSVCMIPGNERKDVERGGKSKYLLVDFFFSILICI